MKDLTKKFMQACNRTDIWKSDQEESARYSRYPRYKGFDRLKYHLVYFMSKWEWKPREKFHILIKGKSKWQ